MTSPTCWFQSCHLRWHYVKRENQGQPAGKRGRGRRGDRCIASDLVAGRVFGAAGSCGTGGAVTDKAAPAQGAGRQRQTAAHLELVGSSLFGRGRVAVSAV